MAEESNDVKSAGPSSPRSPQNNTIGGKPSSPHSPRQPRRVKLTQQQLESMTKEELAAKWHEQDLYVECLEAQAAAQEGELSSLRESDSKYRQQHAEASHREKILVRRLASKEQELQEYINQIAEMKAAHAPSATALRSALLDPAVNILIQKLRQELVTTKAKLEDTQNELSAWKFTPDSNTGKRLMAKCRLLYQENEELGRMIASGRIAKLEGDLVLQRNFCEEMKKSQSELDEFLQDLDEDVEGMQTTIYFLQQELRKAHESVTLLQQENTALKTNSSENNLTNGLSPHTPPIKKEEPEENSILDTKTSKSTEDSDMCKGARTPPLSSERSPQCEFSNTERTDRGERKPNQADHNDESSSDSAALIIKVENEELSDREEEHEENRNNKRILRSKSHNRSNNKSNGEEMLTRITRGRERTKRDKSAPGSDDERTHKKKRRGSILSLDYNEADDDALVLTNDGGSISRHTCIFAAVGDRSVIKPRNTDFVILSVYKNNSIFINVSTMFAARRTLFSSTIKDAFVRGQHTLPDLPYDYKALEPIISAEIMELHHSKHHATYVNNLNAAEGKLKEAVAKGDVSTQIALAPAIKFNGGGHLNHSIFWCNLSPNSSKPDATLLKQIENDFGSLEELKKQLSESTVAIQGSGWGWLGYCKKSKSLRIATCANQDPLEATTGLVPLFGIDVWEHAYYLQYKNVRPNYVKAIFDIVNWNDVSCRYKNAAGC